MLLYKRVFFIVLDNDEILNLVKQNDFEKLKVLLQNQEDKNPVIFDAGDGSKFTILHTAALYGNLNIIKGFKEELNFTDMNPRTKNGRWTPMMVASSRGNINIINFYIKNEGK